MRIPLGETECLVDLIGEFMGMLKMLGLVVNAPDVGTRFLRQVRLPKPVCTHQVRSAKASGRRQSDNLTVRFDQTLRSKRA